MYGFLCFGGRTFITGIGVLKELCIEYASNGVFETINKFKVYFQFVHTHPDRTLFSLPVVWHTILVDIFHGPHNSPTPYKPVNYPENADGEGTSVA